MNEICVYVINSERSTKSFFLKLFQAKLESQGNKVIDSQTKCQFVVDVYLNK